MAGKSTLREAILRERAIEFGYEEVRYFDLVRWKRSDIFTLSCPSLFCAIPVVANANEKATI